MIREQISEQYENLLKMLESTMKYADNHEKKHKKWQNKRQNYKLYNQ